MDLFPSIFSTWPQSKDEIKELLNKTINERKATYINLTR